MIPKPTLDISIVIPVYNEAESLPPLHAELDAALKALGRSYEIIAVDDGSRDNSLPVLKQLLADIASEPTDRNSRAVQPEPKKPKPAPKPALTEAQTGRVIEAVRQIGYSSAR